MSWRTPDGDDEGLLGVAMKVGVQRGDYCLLVGIQEGLEGTELAKNGQEVAGCDRTGMHE